MANPALGESFEKFVADLVRSGQFASREDVLQEGLRLLQLREQSRGSQLEDMRRQIQVGLDDLERGDIAPLDMAAIRAQARREFEASAPRDCD